MVKTQCIQTVELEILIGNSENNIFFIETNDDITKLHPRLLCAFESAAKHNPTMKVQIQRQRKSWTNHYLLKLVLSCPRVTVIVYYKFQVYVLISNDSNLATVPEYISSYKNIIFAKVNFSKLVNNTSPSKLWKSGAITRSGFYLNNISNVLRILLLLKFGGVYLDSDVISIQQLPRDQGMIVKWFLTNLWQKTKVSRVCLRNYNIANQCCSFQIWGQI